MQSQNPSFQGESKMLNLFCPLGQNVQPQGLVHIFRESNLLVDRLGDEVNATQKACKTYEVTKPSIWIPYEILSRRHRDSSHRVVIARVVLRPNAASPVAGYDDDPFV